MKFHYSMFSTTNTKNKLPSDSIAPTLGCLLNGPFRDLHFTGTDHRVTPLHDIVFLDEGDPAITPLNYRPIATSPTATSSDATNGFNGTNGLDTSSNGHCIRNGHSIGFWAQRNF
ncbi:uncharacterized protein LOC128856955 isoform X2 [Anastrepha ludens]|uniref:uncharacterized protein LOC128856955 isoform X2 n=1 Tax=Anastrepha ludens TaxID=28586 RepID=UPI0023B1015A|nr:uncharacterized protein LOC128856955 isoform X2 [Anastrepha ludens]